MSAVPRLLLTSPIERNYDANWEDVREQRCAVVFAKAWLSKLRVESFSEQMFLEPIQSPFWSIGFSVALITL